MLTIHNSPPALELEVMSLMQKMGKPKQIERGISVVNSLVVGSHSSLLERLGKGRMCVTCACNV